MNHAMPSTKATQRDQRAEQRKQAADRLMELAETAAGLLPTEQLYALSFTVATYIDAASGNAKLTSKMKPRRIA